MTPSSDIIPREVKDIQSSDMKGIWRQLVRITKMRLRIVSLSGTGDCFGRGYGDVQILLLHKHALVLNESGSWSTKSGARFAFWNRYRWIFRPRSQRLILEHLRYGDHNPERLLTFDLWKRPRILIPSKPYLCGRDSYDATLEQTLQGLDLRWNISGPDKNQKTISEYR